MVSFRFSEGAQYFSVSPKHRHLVFRIHNCENFTTHKIEKFILFNLQFSISITVAAWYDRPLYRATCPMTALSAIDSLLQNKILQ